MNNKFKKLTYKEGYWDGGRYYLDGEPYRFKAEETARLLIDGEVIDAVYQMEHGESEGWRWEIMHIGIIDGVMLPRFLSAKALLTKYDVWANL